VGKFAILTDVGGAVIAAFEDGKAAERQAPPEMPPVGNFCWDELHSQDPAASKAYYGELFGWTFKDMDMGPMGIYHLAVCPDGSDVGGMMKAPPEAGAHHAWLSYVHVEDVDATQVKAAELGATTIVPPMDIPGKGRFSVMIDPTGGVFAVFKGVDGQ
jgi:uncharacterized protein